MKEFEGQDLSDAVFWGVNLRNSRFRDVDMSGASILQARLLGVTIDAEIDRLVVNGVDVSDFVNSRDEWFPLRSLLRPTDEAGVKSAWSLLSERWNQAIDRALGLGDSAIDESVDEQWSFAQTLRHLVFVTDKWLFGPVTGAPTFAAMGLPNTGSREFPWPGLDLASQPSTAEVIAAFRDRCERVADVLGSVTLSRLPREVEVLENGWIDSLECIHVVFEEEFHHLRYALRDLAAIEARRAQ